MWKLAHVFLELKQLDPGIAGDMTSMFQRLRFGQLLEAVQRVSTEGDKFKIWFIAICYSSEFPEVGNPEYGFSLLWTSK